jgi:hypothetical protein
MRGDFPPNNFRKLKTEAVALEGFSRDLRGAFAA